MSSQQARYNHHVYEAAHHARRPSCSDDVALEHHTATASELSGTETQFWRGDETPQIYSAEQHLIFMIVNFLLLYAHKRREDDTYLLKNLNSGKNPSDFRWAVCRLDRKAQHCPSSRSGHPQVWETPKGLDVRTRRPWRDTAGGQLPLGVLLSASTILALGCC